jgi:hypothetical protein
MGLWISSGINLWISGANPADRLGIACYLAGEATGKP